MTDFARFLKSDGCNDRIIQLALREIDSTPLALALVDQDEEIREIVFRNMSKRAASFLKEDIRDRAEAAPEAIRAAQELWAGLLEKNRALDTEKGPFPTEALPPKIDLSSRESTIASFARLAEFVKHDGLLPLEEVREVIAHPLLRRGLLMLIEGWDPLLARSILEKYKQSYLRAMEIDYDLVIEGLDSLASRDNPLVTEERLRALVAGL